MRRQIRNTGWFDLILPGNKKLIPEKRLQPDLSSKRFCNKKKIEVVVRRIQVLAKRQLEAAYVIFVLEVQVYALVDRTFFQVIEFGRIHYKELFTLILFRR